ncbi:putative phosphoacetylglucosamine mutase [Dioszegia hungarica]|uniref:Phosphoacetylglucosamine mutase n=1 Tax=Dioszegia hungarica TaxID=4972 RepID=A0AA38H3B6_9TREE|nr:putative phosphoacetylglucosamine mutase [Dioszegia hungarica]KAI9632946.1 putative phosphoacetylglucosamine mutase [Dioszegia hungarica]
MSTSAPADPKKSAHEHAVFLSALQKAADAYPKPQGVKFSYGTAGFRTLGERLPSVMFCCALLAVLRSKKLGGAAIGVMITASHNPEQDNGVKLVDPSGEMLDPTWESHATLLANCTSTESLITTFIDLAHHLRVELDACAPSSIIYARDTRPSGKKLVEAFEAGLSAFQGLKVVDLGVHTTPVLHYVVRATNARDGEQGKPTVEGYYERMAGAFKTLIGNRGPLPTLYVDCANGVGAPAISTLSSYLGTSLPLQAMNDSTTTPGALNSQCGADYVKTRQALPPSVEDAGLLDKPDTRSCSLDGDADRIIYYYLGEGGKFRLLDGDKIAGLVALFLMDLVKKAKLGQEGGEDTAEVGVVQTAYANGSSTKYLKGRGVPVTCVPTGVKHLHHAAQKYDIGVYFEANGHGTVLFSPSFLSTLAVHEPTSPDSSTATKQLLALSQLINQAVGDALSDMLLVEVVLAHRGWTAVEWDAAYEDLPNRLVKVEVADRFLFETTDAERKLTSPAGLQAVLDEAVGKVEMGRSFVRPSGTEDCVRVYAEAKTTAGVDTLATTVSDLVKQYSKTQ